MKLKKQKWLHWLLRDTRLLWLLVGMQILVHTPMLDLSPLGQHTWRQVVGHSIASNYYHEGNSFLETRVDIRFSMEDTGAIYHEFPLTYWLVGQSYHLFGEQNISARLIPLVFNLLLIFFAYSLARSLQYSHRRSVLFSFFISISPLFFYYAPSLVPNMLGLTLFIGGSAFFIQSVKNQRWGRYLGLATLLLSLGTLCKPTYLFYGLTLAYIVLFYISQHRSLEPSLSR